MKSIIHFGNFTDLSGLRNIHIDKVQAYDFFPLRKHTKV